MYNINKLAIDMKRKIYAIFDGARLVAFTSDEYRMRRLRGYGYTVLRAI